MRKDVLAIVEAAYAQAPSTEAWLGGIVDAARPFDPGEGVIAYRIDYRQTGSPGVEAIASRADLTAQGRHWLSHLAPEVVRALHPLRGRVLDSVDEGRRIAQLGAFLARWDGDRLPKAEAVIGGDDSRVAALVFHRADDGPRLSALERRLFKMVIAHLGAAVRLRDAEGEEHVDAWLSPTGKVLDARAGAADKRARASLALAVAAVERARGALRRVSPSEALTLWRGLVQAEWSVVDTVERDGKRVVLARRNRPDVPARPELTADERVVAYFAAQGHASKAIAYELGLSPSAVALHLKTALTKLGVRSRAELARLYGGSG